MSTLKDIITGRQDSKKFRKDNFGNSGERSGMTVVYTGRGETGYERRNFDAQHNSETSIRDIITGKETPKITEMQVNYETKHRYENDGKKIAAIVPKAKKNYDVPTKEQFLEYIKEVGTTDTVPSKDQMTQYKAESDMYRDMDMGSKYGNATYEELKKGYKTETDGREKEWLLNRIKESASSEELEDWKKDLEDTYNSDIESIKNDGTKDKGVQYSQRKKAFDDDTSEIESLIEEKRKQETAQKNQKKDELYSDKYMDYDYKKLKTESSNNKLPDEEREWLKNSADEKATSAELQVEYDSLTKEYNTLYDSRDEESSYNRLKEIEDRQEDLKSLIDKKKYEEKKKAEYDDVIENDIKAKTVMQKYYYLQKYDELNRMFESTGKGIESVKVKSSIDAYNYAKDLTPEERKQIIKDFNSLENKDTLYKYYKREREEQETAEQNQILTDYSEEHPVLGSLASMGLNTYGSIPDTVNYIGAGIDKAFGGDGYINPDSTNVAKAQIMREKVSEDMDGLGKFFYNTGMSIGDNLARMPLLALPGGEAMSLALAGTSAGVSSANDVINSGGSLESALWTGAAAGTAEVVFEKIPLDNLIKLKNEGTDSVFRAVVNQMKTEGLEEVGTDIANAITDQIINGDMSQLALQYQNYIAQGYSEEEARKQIAVDFASQLGQSFAAGAISGGVMSGGTIAINKIGGTIEEKSEKRQSVSQLGREALQSENFNVNELIKSAKKSDNPKAVNLANSLEKVVEEKGTDKVKAVDVGNLLTLTNSDEITYDYSQDLSELTGTDKQNIIDRNFELNGEEKTSKTSDGEVKYTDTKAFGENFPHGLGAKISKTGERITIVGLKSSSKDFNSDDNTVVLLANNGELYDSDDIRTSVSHFNDLFDYAKNFDTIGARVFLSQYEDYVKRSKSRGKTADITEYSECFERLYSYGIKGVTYDSIKKSGNFTREINILSAGVAYSAVQSGNNDFKVDTRDKSNKSQKIRMPGESNSISSKVYVDPGSEDSVKVTDEQLAILQAAAEKYGREIVLTDRMGERTGDENANGGYNPNDGKIYINADVHDSYMLSVSLHEAVHGVAADNPAEYHALCTFITNYLVAKGENIDNLLDDIKIKWGDSVRSEDAALEELVCQTVMAIATDEAAIKTALSLEENKGILKKVASALKKIAKAAYDFIKGVGVQAHNKQAQPWINDIEALNELAVRLEKAFESTRKLNEQRASAAENTETEQKNNTHEGVKLSIRLSDSDLNDYLKAGNRKNKIKLDQIAEGKSIILTNENDIIDYIDDSISGNKKEEIKAYGKANKQLVSEILRETNDSIDVSNYYLELPSDNLFHAYREHSRAKKINNIPLSKEDFEKIPEYFDRHDELLYVRKYASGVTSVCVSKNISNGKILIIETVSKSRGALQFKNAFGLNEEGYIEFLKSHGLKNKISSPSSGGSENSNTMSLPNGTAYDSTLSQNKSSVNNNSMRSNKNNTKHSVDDVIDENRDLVAVHNLSAKKLAKMISDFDGQGIPAPSIAIDKADNVHSDFGKISLIFDRNTIDPKADRRNSVYSRDAWTSMYPKTEFKLNEKAMKKLAERLDMSVNELKTNMFDTSDIQKIKYRFEDDIKVRKAFLKENNIKATPVLRDRQPDIMMFSARAVKKFVRNSDCTFDRLVNDKEFRNELFKSYLDGASLKGIAKAHIEETDEILDLAKSKEFYSVLKEKFDYAIEYAKGNVQQTEGSLTESVNNAIEEYKEEFSSYIDELLSSGVLGEEYIVRDDVDPYDENGNRKPFSKTHYKYNIENVVKAMKSGRSKVGSSFSGGVAYVKSIGAKKLNSIDEIKGNKNKIVPMTEAELEAENERISDLIKPLIEEIAASGSYNNDFITASNNIVDAFNSKNDVNGVYNYLKQYHNKIKMNTVKKLFAAKAEIENLPTRYFEAKPHRAVGFDEVKAAVIPSDTHEALKGALKELGVPMYEYDSNNENSRAEVTQKAINTEYVDVNGEQHSDLRFAVDDTITDGMFADGDLFDDDGYIQQSVFERAVKDNPDFALTAVYNHAAKTAETAIKQSNDVKLDDKAYLLAARRLMTRYDISRKLNKGFDEELAQTIRKHIERMEKGVADFAGELELLVDDCKDALMLSGKLDGEAFKTEREEILGYLRGKTLILSEYAESDVRGDYDTLQNYRKRMFGKINVAYEKNLKNNSKGLFWDSGNNIYINDVIAFVDEHFPHLITDDADDISGYRWLDNLVNNVLKPKFVNNYIDGFYENIDTAAIEMAFDVTTEVINEKAKLAVSVPNAEHRVIKEIAAAKKKAEAEQKALLKAKAESYRNEAKEERRKRIKMIENLRRRMSEITDKSDKQRLKYEAQIEHLKTSLDKTTVILNMGYETIRDQYNSNRERTANINSINNLLAKLEKRYLAPKPKEYIPADIYNPLHDVLTTLIALDGRSKKVGMLAEKMRTLIDKLDAEIVDSKSVLHIPSAFQDALLGYTDEETGKHVDGSLDTVVKIFANSKAKSLKGFSNEEIKQIKDALSQVEAILHSANEIVLAEKRYNAYILSREIEKEIEPVTGTHSKSKVGRALKTGLEMFQNEMNDAKRFARRMVGYKKDSLFVKMFDELNRGQTEAQNLQMEWTNKAMQAYSEFPAKELDDYKHKKALTIRGIDFTADMLVEMALEYQDEYAREHMLFSGYHVPNINYLNKKNKNVAYSKDRSFFFVPTNSDIMTIMDYVRKDKLCSTVYSLCYNLYNEDMQNAVNKISLQKYGYKLAKVRNYCPITIDTDTVEKGFVDVLINRSINSRAFLNMRDKQRHNRLKLVGALDKLGRQIDSVSSWCGLTIPIENFTKVYNMERYDNSFADVDGKRKTFVKDTLPGNELPLIEENVQLNSVLNRLANNEEVTLDEIYNLEIIQKAFSERGPLKPTINDNSSERIALRKKIQRDVEKLGSAVAKGGKWEYNGIVNRDGRIDIVIGLPAAGKSSVIADPLSAMYKSRIVDSDVVKERLPEFNNGLGAGNVHEESKRINKEILKKSVSLKENIVLPIVGSDYDSVIKKIKFFKENGYKVYLHLNELPMYKALGRMINRFVETGRFLEPKLIYDYQNKPTEVFERIIKENGGLIDGYSQDDNRGNEDKSRTGSRRIQERRDTGNGNDDASKRQDVVGRGVYQEALRERQRGGLTNGYTKNIEREEEPTFKYGTENFRKIYDNRGNEENRRTNSGNIQESRRYGSARLDKENGGLIDGYSRYSNDVEQGEEPIFKYGTEDFRKNYLNEVTKIEASLPSHVGPQNSADTTDKLASKEIVPQSSDDFKQNLQNNKPKENNMIYFRSVKENLKLRWGNWADDYISKLMGKLQGATKAETSKLDVLTSNYIRGILRGNLNSAIVQISSYPLAASVVGWKPVAAGLKHIRPGKHTPGLNRVLSDNYKHSVPYDELAKYTPILWYRQQGHNNRDINEINKYKSLGDKSGFLDKLNWIEKMDTIMVDMNYWICYEYVKNELKISPESEEFMPKVAETLEEIINSMMPNSSIMQQGQILRRDNPLMKIFTLCKSQVFCMANAIMDSSGEYIARRQALKSAEQSKNEKLIKEAKADLKESKTKYIRTFSSVTMSVVMTVFLLNVIKAFVTGKYDKYKDEDGNITASSVGLRMLKDFGSEFTGMFLFGDIIYNFALSCIDEDEKFWGVSYPGIEIINDLFTGINKLINSDERNFLDNLRNIIGTAGLAKGLPIKNMDGLIQGIYNHFVNSAFYDFTPAVNNSGEVTTKKFANTCYNALIDGNKQLYNTYHSQWLKQKKSNGEPVDEKYINSKLKEELEDDKGIIAAADAFREGNLDKYEEIVKKYVGFGFKEETVTSAIDSIINETEKSEQSGQADNESETEEEEDKATLYTYSDAFEYLKNGDMENYERIEQYLIDNSDKTKKDVKSAMRSASRTDELWKAYFEAQGTLSGGGDPVKLEELKMILTNIYGSWSTATTYGRKYQERMKKKEREKNK